jgi:hypothetical protein
LDLSRGEADGLAEKYAERLVYAVADSDYSAEPVPIGVDLSGTRLVTEFRAYEGDCALGVSANCPHIGAVERFLEYVLADGAEAGASGALPDGAEAGASGALPDGTEAGT